MREALRPSEQNELDHFLRPDDAREKKEQKNKQTAAENIVMPSDCWQKDDNFKRSIYI